MDLGHLHALRQRHGRQDGGQGSGQHGLAGAGGAGKEQVVAAGGGDLRGPFRRGLALDIGEIPGIGGLLGHEDDGGLLRHVPFAPQELHQLLQIVHGKDPDPLHAGGLGGVLPGHEEHVLPRLTGGDDHGQHPVDPPDVAVEGQFPEIHRPHEGRLLQDPLGGQERESDGQIIDAALLAHVRRGQAHRHVAVAGKVVARVLHGGPDPLLGLLHGGVGQAHRLIGVDPAGDVGFHLHGEAVEAAEAEAVGLG